MSPGQSYALPVILWVKSAELLIGRSPRQPGEMPKEDWDLGRQQNATLLCVPTESLTSQKRFGKDSCMIHLYIYNHIYILINIYIYIHIISSNFGGHSFCSPSLQEAEWFRSMLRTHLAAMQTVQRLTQGRGNWGPRRSVETSGEFHRKWQFLC